MFNDNKPTIYKSSALPTVWACSNASKGTGHTSGGNSMREAYDNWVIDGKAAKSILSIFNIAY